VVGVEHCEISTPPAMFLVTMASSDVKKRRGSKWLLKHRAENLAVVETQ
jgi:hypothetical protein